MTKAAVIFNYYELKNIYLNRNLEYEKFKNDDLISFCKIGKEIIESKKKQEQKVLMDISNFCSNCKSKNKCPETKCVVFRIEREINENKL